MVKNGKFKCFKCVLHHFRMRYDLYIQIYQNSNFHHFRPFFSGFFSGFLKFRRGVLRDEFLVIFGIEHDHNSSIPEGGALTRLILVCSLKSVKIVQNPEIILWCMWRRSSSGWVPMILKVLPSFSPTSGLHFSYISYCCIFNISRSRINFLKKSISKTTFVWMHQITCNIAEFKLSNLRGPVNNYGMLSLVAIITTA